MKQIMFILLALLLASQGLAAQELTCSAVVAVAVESSQTGCGEAGRNEVCYGAGELVLVPSGDRVAFAEVGAIIPASAVQLLQSSALDVDTGNLGVAVMRLQADLTDPTQNVLVVLVGDVSLESAVTQPIGGLLEVTAVGGLNVRGGPSTNAPVVGGLAAGQAAVADARVDAGDWLRIQLPDGELGWVFAALVDSAGSTDSLSVVSDSTLPIASPLRAIHFRTGINTLPCDEALANGALIQTPVDSGLAHLTINGVELALDGTFYVEARNELTVNALEGSGLVIFGDNPQKLVAGSRVRIPLDDDGNWIGDPQATDSYDETLMMALPLALLDRDIELMPALSAEEIDALTACQVVSENNVNLRGGPGTVYPVLETLAAETISSVSGQANGTDDFVWWQLDNMAWVRSDVVVAEGNCETVPEAEAPPVPTPAAGLAADIVYRLDECAAGQILAGQVVEVYVGGGGWSQIEDARTVIAELSGSITVDGVPIVAGFRTHRWGENNYGVKVAGLWTATSGTHQINASLSLFGGINASCTVVVP